MFSLLKKLVTFFGCALGNIMNSISGNFEILTQDKPSRYLLKK